MSGRVSELTALVVLAASLTIAVSADLDDPAQSAINPTRVHFREVPNIYQDRLLYHNDEAINNDSNNDNEHNVDEHAVMDAPAAPKRFAEFMGKRVPYSPGSLKEAAGEQGPMMGQPTLNGENPQLHHVREMLMKNSGGLKGMLQVIVHALDNENKRQYEFVGKRLDPGSASPGLNDFVGGKKRYDFLGKRYDFLGKRYDFVGKRNPYDTIFKKTYDFLGKRYDFVGKRSGSPTQEKENVNSPDSPGPNKLADPGELNYGLESTNLAAPEEADHAPVSTHPAGSGEVNYIPVVDESDHGPFRQTLKKRFSEFLGKRAAESGQAAMSDSEIAAAILSNMGLRKRLSRMLLNRRLTLRQYPEFVGK